MKKSLLYSIFAVLLFSFVSCKKELSPDIGLDLQPEDEALFAYFNDTCQALTLEVISVKEDTVWFNRSISNYWLGSMYDPDFGVSSAHIVTQLYGISVGTADFDKMIKVVDSVTLTLVYDKGYPADKESLDRMTIDIYRLNEYLDTTIYPTCRKPMADTLGFVKILENYPFDPHPYDSVEINDSTKGAPRVTFKLDDAIGRMLMNYKASDLMLDSVNRLFNGNGLYIHAHSETQINKGSFVSFNLDNANTVFTVYFHGEGDSVQYEYTALLAGGIKRYNHFEHDYENTACPDLKSQLAGDTASTQNALYLDGFAGLSLNLKMPKIRDLQGRKMIINQAVLVFPNADKENAKYSPPSGVSISDTVRGLVPGIEDYNSVYKINAAYNKTRGDYRVFITRHVQHLVQDGSTIENKMLKIRTYDPSLPSRMIIPGLNPANKNRLRLELTYTLVP